MASDKKLRATLDVPAPVMAQGFILPHDVPLAVAQTDAMTIVLLKHDAEPDIGVTDVAAIMDAWVDLIVGRFGHHAATMAANILAASRQVNGESVPLTGEWM